MLMIGMSACQQSLNVDRVAETILEVESERLPMTLKEIPYLDTITIDSIHIYKETEPMAAFIYTTWYDSEGSIDMIVQVEGIKKNTENKGQIEWKSFWSVAEIDYEIEKTQSYKYHYIK